MDVTKVAAAVKISEVGLDEAVTDLISRIIRTSSSRKNSKPLLKDLESGVLLGVHASAVDFLRPGLGVGPLGVGLHELRNRGDSGSSDKDSNDGVLLCLDLEVVDELLHGISFRNISHYMRCF